jgi:hypothetical protein
MTIRARKKGRDQPVRSSAGPAADHTGFVTRIRSISCADALRAGLIILNQAVVLACSIWGR